MASKMTISSASDATSELAFLPELSLRFLLNEEIYFILLEASLASFIRSLLKSPILETKVKFYSVILLN
jgi:hypothetical protein